MQYRNSKDWTTGPMTLIRHFPVQPILKKRVYNTHCYNVAFINQISSPRRHCGSDWRVTVYGVGLLTVAIDCLTQVCARPSDYSGSAPPVNTCGRHGASIVRPQSGKHGIFISQKAGIKQGEFIPLLRSSKWRQFGGSLPPPT